jgi:hypothetical protein
MLTSFSIKSLYALALAEGEGVGTAYEYFAKRLVLGRWLQQVGQPARLLVAGLPQKYGSSLDFLLLAEELGAAVVVVDERPSAVDKLQSSLQAAQAAGWLTAVSPHNLLVANLADLSELEGPFDLCISAEVLQRLPTADRSRYAARLRQLGTAVALFAPNEDNPAHTHISGLDGLTLAEIQSLLPSPHFPAPSPHSGYVDMPPFPPGVIRSEEQRAQATSGRLEAFAMWALGYYARLEHWLPIAIRRRQSHIVYALVARNP